MVINNYEELPAVDVQIDISERLFLNDEGEFRVFFDHSRTIRDELGLGFTARYRVEKRTFVLTTVTDDWPFDGDIEPGDEVFPDIGSNVTNGTGYVAGVSKIDQIIIPTPAN